MPLKTRLRMRVVLAITAAFAVIASLFVGLVASPAMATNPSSGECVTTWEWQRDIPQSHTEYKYEKTIPATEGVKEYKYKKLVKGTEAGPDLWWNWSPNYTQGPQDYEPAFPSDPRGTWQGPHENGGPEQDTYGTFQTGPSGNSNWFHREHGTPGTEDSWEYSGWTTEKLGPPWILIDERWKVEPQPEQTVLYKDGAWTTDTPGEPWVKVDERTVTDEPLHQGPVRSADEPDRGDYTDVAWTKIPDTEEQTGDCDNPTGPTPKWTVGDCTDNNQRPVTLTITVPKTDEGSTLVRLKKDNVTVDSKQLATFEGEKVATFNLGNLPAGTYTNYSADYSNIYLEGFVPIELGDLVVAECKDTPPPVIKYTLDVPVTCVKGLDNGLFNDKVGNITVTPSGAASVQSSINGNTLTVTTTPNEGSAPKSPADLVRVIVDNGGNCGNNPPPHDECPNLPGNQPEGTDCTPNTPPTDKCPDKPGMQGPNDSCTVPPVNNPPTDVAPPPSTDKSDGPMAQLNPFTASLALIALIGAAIAADSRRRKEPELVPTLGRHRA